MPDFDPGYIPPGKNLSDYPPIQRSKMTDPANAADLRMEAAVLYHKLANIYDALGAAAQARLLRRSALVQEQIANPDYNKEDYR
jgi:hypothetical protein